MCVCACVCVKLSPLHFFFFFSEATCVSIGGAHTPSLKPSLDVGEGIAAHQVSTVTVPPQSSGQITLFDLLETLLVRITLSVSF